MTPLETILDKLPRARKSGNGWTARCPAHEDATPSLGIDEGDDGRVLLTCRAGCRTEDVVAAVGMTMADLFPPRITSPNGQKHTTRQRSRPITLAELAKNKALPLEFLRDLGWHDLPGGGVGIPYRDENGKSLHVKRRTALKAREGSYWPRGVPLMPYGLEALPEARKAGSLILNEGETDTETQRYHGFHALGIPGADSTKVLQAEHVQGIDTLYAWQETDPSGALFVQGLTRRLAEIGYKGQAKVIRLAGVKDASELHMGDPEGFPAAMQQAMATAEELPRGKPQPGLVLTRLCDLLAEPEDVVEWLVEGLLPSGGFSLLAGKPKAGKSTLARCLALSVARGDCVLGRQTAGGPVIYLALEEKRSEVRKHFQAMGASGKEEIYIFAATAPADALEQLRAVVEEKKPALLIIDPLFRFTRVKDGNDYAQVTQALEPLMALARQTGTHVLVVHHLGKGERLGADAILGSTAIRAAVDTSLILKRLERYRTLCSEQRYGDDLEETTLRFDTSTRVISLGETKEREDEAVIAQAIMDYLGIKGEPVTEAEIDAEVEGKTRLKRKGLRDLLKAGVIQRSGRGGKSDPFRYTIHGTPANSNGNTNPSGETHENAQDDPAESILVPLFPVYSREQENKKLNRGASGDEINADSCSQGFGDQAILGDPEHDPGNKHFEEL